MAKVTQQGLCELLAALRLNLYCYRPGGRRKYAGRRLPCRSFDHTIGPDRCRRLGYRDMIVGLHGRGPRRSAACTRDMKHRLVVGAFRQGPEQGVRCGGVGVEGELRKKEHHVVEGWHRQFRQPVGAADVDENLLAGDPLGPEQGAHERDLVLAIAELVLEHGRRRVRGNAAGSEQHEHVSNVLLDPAIDRLGLSAFVFDAFGDVVGECLDFLSYDIPILHA